MPTSKPPPDIIISLRRTIVPIVVGWIIAQLLRLGIDADASLLTPIFNELVIAVYYTLARLAESRWPGRTSILLGSLSQPHYSPSSQNEG